MSLNLDELETPYQAFLRKLPAERVMGYAWRWYGEHWKIDFDDFRRVIFLRYTVRHNQLNQNSKTF